MYLTLAWRNIWRNKRRSYITIGSITFAVLLACSMRSMQLGSYDRMIENAARFYTGYIQIHENGFWSDKSIDNSFVYDQQLIDTISTVTGVDIVVPRLESFALVSFAQKTKGGLVMGVDPDREDELTRVRDKIVAGSYIASDDRSIMISEGLATYLKAGVGDSIVLIGQGFHGANSVGIYPIKGIMKFPSPAQNNGTIYLPLKEAQWLYAVENRLTSLALVIDQAKNTDRIVADISNRVDTEQLEVMSWETMMPDLVQGIEVDNISGKMMIWILYAVIGFGMFGTFLMMTAERMYEFGVLISIGMKRVQLQWAIFLEMLIMSSIGVALGVSITLPFLIYYYHHPIFFTGESAEAIEKFGVEPAYFFSLQPSLFYSQAWVIFVMAVILGLYPLIVLLRLKPVKAMRGA
ncbi:MAG: putative ABC transport system permease protein [Cyclobacteriaceae bacterium]|jgi:putative ABC transport system permease protein